jgi:hypothetical protein
MKGAPKNLDVQAAAMDLKLRTLSQFPDPLARLLYLAGLRNYNTGLYHHEGLAARFSADVACEALADCHREAFRETLLSSLEDTVRQLETYMESTAAAPLEFFGAWSQLRPYLVAVPAQSDPLSAEFVCSNLKVALAILQSRYLGRSQAPNA